MAPETTSSETRGKLIHNSRLLQKYGPLALVLGASEGIGLAFAGELARNGFKLLLASRRPEVLARAADSIRSRYDTEVETLCLDLAEPRPWPVLERALGARDCGLVVYNAAASPIGHFLDLDLEKAARTISVNITSPMEITHGAGNRFRKRYRQTGKRGGIILMSSMSALRGTPVVSVYAASKAWNLILAEGAGVEARPEGVDLMACVAGATDTPGYRDSVTGRGPGAPVQSPAAVAAEALKKLGRRNSMIPGIANRLIAFLMYGLIPRRWSSDILGMATGGLRRRGDAGLS